MFIICDELANLIDDYGEQYRLIYNQIILHLEEIVLSLDDINEAVFIGSGFEGIVFSFDDKVIKFSHRQSRKDGPKRKMLKSKWINKRLQYLEIGDLYIEVSKRLEEVPSDHTGLAELIAGLKKDGIQWFDGWYQNVGLGGDDLRVIDYGSMFYSNNVPRDI